MTENNNTFVSHIFRFYERYAVIGFSLLLVGVGAFAIFSGPVEQRKYDTPIMEDAVSDVDISKPVMLRIPKLSLEASFEEPLGVDVFGAIEVPEDHQKVGWYKYGPTPGQRGPAVVLGHVDSFEGPSIFYELHRLEEGDVFSIEREDGSIIDFEVTSLEEHPQSEFPTQAVYGNIDHAGIRLITCAGSYNSESDRFSHNLIVFGKRIEV